MAEPVGVRVGVVVPAFQAEHWLATTLASVRGQSDGDWVCVVVDDGSTDGTARCAAAAAAGDDRITWVHQPNRGISAARNTGVAALPPVDLVAFLDSDDVWRPHALASLVAALDHRPDAVGAFGLAELVDGAGAPLRPGAHPARQRARRRLPAGRGGFVPVAPGADLTLAELVTANPFWPPATGLLRRRALVAAGGFDETYRLQEDWHLWLRVARGGPLVALDEVVADYRQHGFNLTGDWRANFLGQDRLRQELAADPRQAGSVRRLARRSWRRELREGTGHEVRRVLAARRPADVVAGLVRAGTGAVQALVPGGPRAGALGVRWRPRGPG